jgi:multiple sugar transport system permease protein
MLPYLLSLPALLVCIAILVPFVTAGVYSLQRYRLNLPYLRGFIGVDNYIDFLRTRRSGTRFVSLSSTRR